MTISLANEVAAILQRDLTSREILRVRSLVRRGMANPRDIAAELSLASPGGNP